MAAIALIAGVTAVAGVAVAIAAAVAGFTGAALIVVKQIYKNVIHTLSPYAAVGFNSNSCLGNRTIGRIFRRELHNRSYSNLRYKRNRKYSDCYQGISRSGNFHFPESVFPGFPSPAQIDLQKPVS